MIVYLYDLLAETVDLERWSLAEHGPDLVGIYCEVCGQPVAVVDPWRAMLYPVVKDGPEPEEVVARPRSQTPPAWGLTVAKCLEALAPCPSLLRDDGTRAQILPIRGPRPRSTLRAAPNPGGQEGSEP